jgi:hypothetical protein
MNLGLEVVGLLAVVSGLTESVAQPGTSPLSVPLSVVEVIAQDGTGSTQSVDDRLERLEKENQELRRRIDVVAGEVERVSLGDLLVPPVGDSQYGFGPAASKIYTVDQGISIGGYGEFLYENFQGSGTDQFDALRAVLYFGYKFNDKWLFNSEIEFEHGSTSSNPDGQSGSASVEVAYLEYKESDAIGARGGMLLIPMGFLNELHEPTTFLSAERTVTENRILPTTWRETGIGVFGSAGGFDWRSYLVAGFEGKGFSASGLRGGRQKGNRADAEDIAIVTRVDYVDTPGLMAGGSIYLGHAGQDVGVDVPTRIYEAHAEWKNRGFHARALGALANLDDVPELNAAANGGPLLGAASIGEELTGWYLEFGYDLFTVLNPESEQSLTPFVRYEDIDTQKSVPTGFASNPANDSEILTFGVAYQPIDSVIIKLDYQDWDNGLGNATDQWNFALGYVF